MIAPLGPVYQAGTLSGNPVAVAAGLATLELIAGARFLRGACEQTTRALTDGLNAAASAHRRGSFVAQAIGGMFGIYFRASVRRARYAEVMQCDVPAFNRFFHAMLDARHLLRPVGVRSGIRLAAHGAVEIEKTLAAARSYFARAA